MENPVAGVQFFTVLLCRGNGLEGRSAVTWRQHQLHEMTAWDVPSGLLQGLLSGQAKKPLCCGHELKENQGEHYSVLPGECILLELHLPCLCGQLLRCAS